MRRLHHRLKQRGSTIAEFIYAVPAIMLLGLGSVQAGLIYHGKSTLNYATFEAARHGAVNHAQFDAMKSELSYRLAPLYGGDGTAEKAAQAIAKAKATSALPARTSIHILNPTPAAFEDWGEMSLEAGVRAIPNSHLRHRTVDRSTVGNQSGLNLHDANLLKIKVTHGFEMKIPFVAGFIAKGMALADSNAANAHFYAQNQIPITSVVTVRMQNEAWEQDWEAGIVPPVPVTDPGTTGGTTQGDGLVPPNSDSGGEPGGETGDTSDTDGNTSSTTSTTATTGTDGDDKSDEVECESKWEDARYTANTDNRWWNPLDWEDDIKAAAAVVWDFFKGALAGLGDQVKDLWELLKDPTVLWDVAKAFIGDPKGTIKAIVKDLGDQAQKVLNCGPKDIGRVIGQNINPAIAVKLLGKLGSLTGNAKLADYANDFGKKFDCASFPAGTPIWTPEGKVYIEDITVGAFVNSRNENGYVSEPQRVKALLGREAPGYQLIDTEAGLIQTTPEHPFWVQGKGWVVASELTTEDPVATADGDIVILTNDYIAQDTRVYNFSVANTPNYFAGNMGLWVHNASDGITCGLSYPVPDKIDFSELGDVIGSGGRKDVHDWKDGLVVGVRKWDAPDSLVVNEFNMLKQIEAAGLPVVKAHGLTTVQGRAAIVMSKIDGVGSKDIDINLNGPTPPLNARSAQELRAIKQMLIDKNMSIDDLQFLIGNDGSIRIADPAGIQVKPPSRRNIDALDKLIEAAERAS